MRQYSNLFDILTQSSLHFQSLSLSKSNILFSKSTSYLLVSACISNRLHSAALSTRSSACLASLSSRSSACLASLSSPSSALHTFSSSTCCFLSASFSTVSAAHLCSSSLLPCVPSSQLLPVPQSFLSQQLRVPLSPSQPNCCPNSISCFSIFTTAAMLKLALNYNIPVCAATKMSSSVQN